MSRPPMGDLPIESPACYEIRVDGVVDSRWSTWFEDLQVTSDAGGQAVIAGRSLTRRRCTACSPGSATSTCR